MTTRRSAVDEARRVWPRLAMEIGDQLRGARRIAGLSQTQVGKAIGVSQAEISRRERGRTGYVIGVTLAAHAAAVGLKVSIKLFPIGGEIRDAAQARYIAQFLGRVGRLWQVTLEAPMRIPGDLRAVDVMLSRGDVVIAVEVITRAVDLQAQIRAATLKARDAGATRLILVVAATHANRRALAEAGAALVAAFDLDTRRVMDALAAGRDPVRDAIVKL